MKYLLFWHDLFDTIWVPLKSCFEFYNSEIGPFRYNKSVVNKFGYFLKRDLVGKYSCKFKSILDYIFRELAISYLDRNDLGHVDVNNIDTSPTGVGVRGDETTHKVASRGFVRRELKVVSGGSTDNVSVFQTKDYLDTYENKITDINEDETSEVLVKQNSTISKEIEAKIKGFEGEACGECGNFTLVRNGTCMKCNTCGATSGCS